MAYPFKCHRADSLMKMAGQLVKPPFDRPIVTTSIGKKALGNDMASDTYIEDEELETDYAMETFCPLSRGSEDVGGCDRAAGAGRIVGLAYADLVPLVMENRWISPDGRGMGGDRRVIIGLIAGWLAAIY